MDSYVMHDVAVEATTVLVVVENSVQSTELASAYSSHSNCSQSIEKITEQNSHKYCTSKIILKLFATHCFEDTEEKYCFV